MIRRTLPLLALALLLPACGLKPVYSGGSSGAVAQTLNGITVAPIEGKAGWLMMQAVGDRVGRGRDGDSKYRLDIKLDDQITAFGILSDDSTSRERRTLRARYQLVDLASGLVVLDATVGSDAGIDVVQSEYATIAAEESALERLTVDLADQITTRVALFANRQAPPQ